MKNMFDPKRLHSVLCPQSSDLLSYSFIPEHTMSDLVMSTVSCFDLISFIESSMLTFDLTGIFTKKQKIWFEEKWPLADILNSTPNVV